MMYVISITKFIERTKHMIINLKFDVEFASTGKKLSGNHDFQTGLSSITGRNEAGKSLRLEFIRFALFGSEALRAETKSYTSLDVTLTFKVKDDTYEVKRSLRKANLTKGKTPVATGTSPVNIAIITLFGYDLEVFDIANACNQGQIEAMTNKRPAERKQMIDRVIGLDAVDKVISKASEDMSGIRKTIAMLENQVLVTYEAPKLDVELVNLNVKTVAEELDKLRVLSQRKQFINGTLNGLRTEQPLEPVITPVLRSLDELYNLKASIEVRQQKQRDNKALIDKFAQLNTAAKSENITSIVKFIDEDYKGKWNDYKAYLNKSIPQPTFTQTDIDFVREGMTAHLHNTQHVEDVSCPSCSTHFKVTSGKEVFVPKVFNLEAFHAVAEKLSIKITDPFPTAERKLITLENQLVAYEAFKALPVVEKPDLGEEFNQPAVYKAYKEVEAFKASHDLDRIVAEYTNYVDEGLWIIEEQISTIKQNTARLEDYNTRKQAYDKYQNALVEFSEELKTLENVDTEIADLRIKDSKLRAYEQAVAVYNSKMQAQEEALKVKAELELELEMLNRVRKALNELKPKVKMHLLPSLNQVASQLLTQMTNGLRQKIKVDEDFEIYVDGQHVKTLSGSAKAVANLAVRIALGTVLTNKVFSVFLADEIDAAMDDERAEYTAQALKNLTKTFNQIILVSHKEPEADHNILV